MFTTRLVICACKINGINFDFMVTLNESIRVNIRQVSDSRIEIDFRFPNPIQISASVSPVESKILPNIMSFKPQTPVILLFPTGIAQPALDSYDSPVYRNIVERMQGFFSSLYENWLEDSSSIIDFSLV